MSELRSWLMTRDFYGGWVTSNIKGKMKGGEWYFLQAVTPFDPRTRHMGLVNVTSGCDT